MLSDQIVRLCNFLSRQIILGFSKLSRILIIIMFYFLLNVRSCQQNRAKKRLLLNIPSVTELGLDVSSGLVTTQCFQIKLCVWNLYITLVNCLRATSYLASKQNRERKLRLDLLFSDSAVDIGKGNSCRLDACTLWYWRSSWC